MKRIVLTSGMVALALIAAPGVYQRGLAVGSDFSLNFVASAPFSYDHDAGGGAFNDRTVGRFDDVVESLEGGDFACGDVVTFLTRIAVNGGAAANQTIRLNFQFTAHSSGQQGVALIDNDTFPISAGLSAAINTSAVDTGTVDDDGSTATVVPGSEIYDGVTFLKPTTFYRSVDVTDLEAGESVVVRTDVGIACSGQTPTGNMQARLASAQVIAPTLSAIPAGAQTIPFKHVGDIKVCDPKDPNCVPPCDPKDPKCVS
jgi:hypothetical protein